MALTYATWVTQLCNLMVVSSADTNIQTQLPGFIDNAEQRIYREHDFLATRVTNSVGTLTANSRLTTLSTTLGNFLVVEEVNVFTPTSTGSRTQLTNVNRAYINACYPSDSVATGTPQFWAMADNATIVVGPASSQAYPIEVIGTVRPTPLSSGNSSTFLTTYLPDLFMAASMIYASAYKMNYGSGSDDPASAQSWEALYQKYSASAMVEELRKKHQAEGWTPAAPSPIATPPRA